MMTRWGTALSTLDCLLCCPMCKTLSILIFLTSAFSCHCAEPSTVATNTLQLFVVSEPKILGGRFIDTPASPRLGYIATQSDLVITQLQSVVTNIARSRGTLISKDGKETTFEERQQPGIIITMWPEDARRFTEITAKNVGKKVLLMLGDKPLLAPRLVSPIETPSLQLTLGKEKDSTLVERELTRLVRVE